MNFIIQASIVLLVTFISLGVFGLLPVGRENLESEATPKVPLLTSVNLKINYSLTLICTVMFIPTRLGMNPKFVAYFLVILFVGCAIRGIARLPIRSLFKPTLFIGFASLVGLWQFLPALYHSSPSGLLPTMVTHGNNDIAAYALAANEFSSTGFTNSGHLVNLNVNHWALHSSYELPNLLISFIHFATTLPVANIMIPVITISIGYATLSLASLASTVSPKIKDFPALAIAAIIMLTGILTYIESHFFLGQILAIGISSSLLRNFFDYLQNKNLPLSRRLETSVLFCLGIYAYPHLLIPIAFLFLSISALSNLIMRQHLNYKKFVSYLIYVLVGALLALPYLAIGLRLALDQSKVLAGWRLPIINPLFNFIAPQKIGLPTSPHILWLTGGTCLCIYIYLLVMEIRKKGRRNVISKTLFSGLLFLSWLIVNLVKKWNFEDYSSWKLYTYFFPLILLMIITQVYESLRNANYYLIAVGSLFAINSISVWTNGSNFSGSYLSPDLLVLENNVRVAKIQDLNLELYPHLETMGAATMLRNKFLNLTSPNYFGTWVEKNGCSLIHNEASGFKYRIKLNHSYSLASNVYGACGDSDLSLIQGQVKSFAYLDEMSNQPGWSTSEGWGTWSDGPRATIGLNVNFKSLPHEIVIKSHAFLDPLSNTQQVLVSLGGQRIGELIYTSKKNEQTIVLPIPKRLAGKLKQGTRLEFEINRPTKPSSSSKSRDSRNLGIGLESLKVN